MWELMILVSSHWQSHTAGTDKSTLSQVLARTLTQDEVNAKGRAVQDACLFKQSESRKRFSAFARGFKQEGTKKNRWNLKERSLNYV